MYHLLCSSHGKLLGVRGVYWGLLISVGLFWASLVGIYRLEAPAAPFVIRPPTQPPSTIMLSRVDLDALKSVCFETGREAEEFAILEVMGGGVGCIDYDLDGRCDLYFPCGGGIDGKKKLVYGKTSSFLRNLHDGEAVDVATEARADASHLYAQGIAVADYNGDGFSDFVVYGFHGVVLYTNQGDGTFLDTTDACGLMDMPWTTSVAWFDANGDGLLDLYGTGYVNWSFQNHPECESWYVGERDVCPPLKFEPLSDWFCYGEQTGAFTRDDTVFAVEEEGRGLGVLAFRSLPDEVGMNVYVANDMTVNSLFVRSESGKYVDEASLRGVAVDYQGRPNASMGIGLMDANCDQTFDIFVTNFDHELMALYINQGFAFHYSSNHFGLNVEFPPVVGFGVATADLDCDGDEDVFVANGGAEYEPYGGSMEQEPVLLENVGAKRFFRICPDPVFRQKEVARGCAVLDWDNDGYPDFVTSNLWNAPQMYRNTTAPDNGWLRIRLIGRESPRTPIGAIVTIQAESASMIRQLYGGGSYLSQSQQELFFGVGSAKVVDIDVSWPSGRTQRLEGVSANQQLTVVENIDGSYP